MNLVLCFILFSICTALPVKKINIIGNEHTNEHIILREIYHPVPGEFDSILAVEDRDRIYNLGIFSTVKTNQIDSSYTVFVIETFHLLPIPIVEYEEGKGFSYGAGITFLNFRGLNEKLTIGGIGGEKTTYFFDFIDPWVYGDHGSINAEIYQFHSQSANYNYSCQKRAMLFGSGFYKGKHHKFKFELGYENIQIIAQSINSEENSKKTYSDGDTIHNYIRWMISYKYDTRDIYIDPTYGEKFVVKLIPKIGLNSISNRLNIELSYKKFISFKDWILDPVLSFKSNIILKKRQDLPVFENEYLGGENFVRGYSPVIKENPEAVQNKVEGTHIIYQNIQLQHTFLTKHDYNGLEMGLDLVYFADYGISANSLGTLKLRNGIIGYGMGVRLFVSGLGKISLDFGFNPYGSWFFHP